jgi:cellulose synthase/poly-beta-1,6-N-acetylglucosamine synthase-like glycosyltransferase
MNALNFLWYLTQFYVGYNLVLPFLFFLIGKFKRTPNKSFQYIEIEHCDYAIIVTAYKEASMIPSVVNSLLKLDYSNYIIYVVLDNCEVIQEFDNDKIILLYPSTTLASNVKSHFFAIDNFRRPHNYITIIDSDNLVDSKYLSALNMHFAKGFQAVQGIRKAKNLNTTYACLDAARDLYYHFYDGILLFNLGSSATLAGSGMAFSTSLYKALLTDKTIEGAGFDKVLQYQILKGNLRISFCEEAIVYDEKTSKTDQLVQQRSRWINTWFKYMKYGFRLFGSGLKMHSINQTLFGLILLRPPIFMFISLSLVFMVINFFMNSMVVIIWLISLFIFVLGFCIALKKLHADSRIYKSLVGIPKFIFFQTVSLIKSRKANRLSVATTHYHKITDDDL